MVFTDQKLDQFWPKLTIFGQKSPFFPLHKNRIRKGQLFSPRNFSYLFTPNKKWFFVTSWPHERRNFMRVACNLRSSIKKAFHMVNSWHKGFFKTIKFDLYCPPKRKIKKKKKKSEKKPWPWSTRWIDTDYSQPLDFSGHTGRRWVS